MQISKSFDIREFVPKGIFETFGVKSTWFINERVIKLAEFYKARFLAYYQAKYNGKVKDVGIIINDWHKGGTKQWRGFRPRSYNEGAENSQHRFCNAFDCDIIIVFADGKTEEADYPEIHFVIMANQKEFMEAGLSAIEDVSIAATWLHSDCRYIPNQEKILIVKP